MRKPIPFIMLMAAALLIGSVNFLFAQKKSFTWQDAMKFKAIKNAVISDDASWVAFSAIPDRGDPEASYIALDESRTFTIARGINPEISRSSLWAKAVLKPKALDIDNAKTPKDTPKNGLSLLNLQTGMKKEFENVKSNSFSNDSKWLAYHLFPDDNAKKSDGDKNKFKEEGSELVLRHLESGTEIKMDYVTEYQFDSTSNYLFYAVSSKKGNTDGIYFRNLNEPFCPEKAIQLTQNCLFSNISWNIKNRVLSFVISQISDCGKPKVGSVWLWNSASGEINEIVADDNFKGWFIPAKNNLKWSKDGSRLFFGLKPIAEIDTSDTKDPKFSDSTFYETADLLKRAKMYLWHWNDQRISTHQRNWWDKNKDRTFAAVYHMDSKKSIQLADKSLETVVFSEAPSYAIGYDENPYMKLQTWEGFYNDLYIVNLNTGSRKKIAEKIDEGAYLSFSGKIAVFYKNKNWYIYDTSLDSIINLSSRAETSFADLDFDEPRNPPSYGFGGFVDNDKSFLVYNKWDIWEFSTRDGYGFICNTVAEGKIENKRFRIIKTDKEKDYFTSQDTLILQTFSYENKSYGFSLLELRIMGPEPKLMTPNRYNFIAKAKNSDKFLITKESFEEFPDLCITDYNFKEIKKITNVNPQKASFKWGKSELTEWKSSAGDTLQGILIKPTDYNPAKRYPVLIYFYDRFSDYLFHFHQPMLTHRPCFQIYLSEGYVIFEPDIKYRDGFPGQSALDALLSGAKHLVKLGIADSNAIGIQGHSWGAYQAAYIATQTDYFKASCAGAPVGNMVSAYSGIRLESGMARQFQYEAYQSRIGGNLWDSLDNYLRNSPVIEAKGMTTPLLISHGEIDEAVPWQQSVELYLAMRRLNKNCIFLQYPDEPHHLKKYWNKLDYSIKMKEFFDTYLLGKPAPEWILKGKPYYGEEK